MSGFNRLLCMVGVHARSGRRVIRKGDTKRSVCRHCRVAMTKHGETWRVATGSEIAEIDESDWLWTFADKIPGTRG